MIVWLPQAQVAFAGDIVYVDRLLAVLPLSFDAGFSQIRSMLLTCSD